jgi:hypothetical protein
MYQFPHRGKEVTVSSENKKGSHKVQFVKDGVINEYLVEVPSPAMQTNILRVKYTHVQKSLAGDIIQLYVDQYYSLGKEYWDYYYNIKSNLSLGETLSKFSLNGLLYHLLNVQCFDATNNFAFYKSVTYDVAITAQEPVEEEPVEETDPYAKPSSKEETAKEPTAPTLYQIAVTPVDGIAPFQYKLDAGEWQDANVFIDVKAGQHRVFMRDSLGSWDWFPYEVGR